MAKKPGRPELPEERSRAVTEGQIQARPDAQDELRLEIERRIAPLLPAGAATGQVVESMTLLVREESFSGPIPHPRHFEKYEQVVPGSADRLIRMAEKQLEHNMAVNRDAMKLTFQDARLGMVLGFVALALLIGGGVFSIAMGSEIGAGLFLGTGALGVIGLFLKRQFSKPE